MERRTGRVQRALRADEVRGRLVREEEGTLAHQVLIEHLLYALNYASIR